MANRYLPNYFSDDGSVIYAGDGTPLLYRDGVTATFHRYADGCPVLYYDVHGEHLYPFRNVPPLPQGS